MQKGDLVVCIIDYTSARGYKAAIKGKVYKVIGVFNCPCGNSAIDIGIETPRGVIMRAPCHACGSKHLWPKIWYQPIKNFVPVDWDDCREELIEQVMKPKSEVEPFTVNLN